MPPFDTKMARRHKHGLSEKQARQWGAVATSTYTTCIENGGSAERCEARAIRAANSAVGTPAMSTEQSLPCYTIVAHVSQAQTRHEWLDDREYLVARVVPIVEGVLNNYLVPAEEIAACVDAWNDLPLPIGHPQNEYGEFVSGKSPEMIAQSVGRFFNAYIDGKKLIGEVWVDIEKCQRLGGEAAECLRRIEANEIIEVSTAFYPTTTMQQGIWNGVRYEGIHRHLRPNHLALLPSGIGACHAGMGCGIRAAQAHQECACDGPCTCKKGDALMEFEGDVKHPGKLRQALRTLFAFANGAEDEEHAEDNPPPEDEEHAHGDEDKEEQEEGQEVLATHLTHDDLRMALHSAIKAGRNDPYACMIHDIEDAYVIYSEGDVLYRRAYTVGEDQAVTLSGDPEAVQRVTTYVPAAQPPQGTPVTTNEQKGAVLVMLTKPQLITQIINHAQTAWTEEQTPVLETMEERVLEQLLSEANRRDEQAPLTLESLNKFLTEKLDAQAADLDKKLATFSQRAEEKNEREQLEQVMVTHGWPAEEAQALSIQALRRMHQTLDPVSYVGNGLPRMPAPSAEDAYPSDEPDWK